MFTIRKMQKEDKNELLALSSKIWEGSDYIPYVFDSWINDTQGEFSAIECDGKIIGCGRMVFFTPTDVWFEGLRKDPDVEVKGVGTAIATYYLKKLAAVKGLTSIRFSTYFNNVESIVLNTRLGFELLTDFSLKNIEFTWSEFETYRAMMASQYPVSEVLPLNDVGLIEAYLHNSGFLEKSLNLMTAGWEVYPYSRQFLEEFFVRKGCCFGVMKDGELAGMYIGRLLRVGGEISFIHASEERIFGALVGHLVGAFGEKSVPGDLPENRKVSFDAIVPDFGSVLKNLGAVGFKSWEKEHDFQVYFFPLEKLSSF